MLSSLLEDASSLHSAARASKFRLAQSQQRVALSILSTVAGLSAAGICTPSRTQHAALTCWRHCCCCMLIATFVNSRQANAARCLPAILTRSLPAAARLQGLTRAKHLCNGLDTCLPGYLHGCHACCVPSTSAEIGQACQQQQRPGCPRQPSLVVKLWA